MKPVLKLWLDQDGKAFGDGPYELLQRIEATGSLQKAAAQMGMSYSKAWKLMREIERRLGFPLLDRRIGGPSGGGSQITSQAKKLMRCFGRFQEKAQEAIERIYQKQFVSLSKSPKNKEDLKWSKSFWP